jgi:glycerate kinase
VAGEQRTLQVSDPLGNRIQATYGLLRQGKTAVIELAQASGLTLVPKAQRDPGRTSTYGTGELILAACQGGAEEILIGLGGSATNDGAAGIATALGFQLLDKAGDPLQQGGLELLRLHHIDPSRKSAWLAHRRFRVACDVTNPLIGPLGAAMIFGPQKGASAAQVVLLDHALAHFADIVQRDLGVEIATLAGAGAAGGAGGGLVAFLGASLESGIDLLLQAIQFQQQVASCDLVITGEGRLDHQSFMGKAVSGVVRAASLAHKPVLILAGEATPAARSRMLEFPHVQILTILGRARSHPEAIRRAAHYLELLTQQALRAHGTG